MGGPRPVPAHGLFGKVLRHTAGESMTVGVRDMWR